MSSQLHDRFTAFIDGKQDISDKELQEHFKGEYKGLVQFINEFLKSRRLVLLRQADGSLVYRQQSVQEANKYRDLDQDHMLVLQEIANARNEGIWTRTIKFKTKLQQQTISKILKNLEGRKLVKSVKSITSKNKKLYMLFDLTPAREHTGGPWYTDQEYDEEFVNLVSTWMLKCIGHSRGITLEQLSAKLQSSKISRVELAQSDVKLVLDTLIYDGSVEEFKDPNGDDSGSYDDEASKKWKLVSTVDPVNHFTETPCGICPVFDQCTEGGLISPARCIYMNEWLDSDGLLF